MSFLSKTNYSKREGEKRGERERKIQLKSSDTSPDVPSITLPHRDTHTQIHMHTNIHSNYTKAACKLTL